MVVGTASHVSAAHPHPTFPLAGGGVCRWVELDRVPKVERSPPPPRGRQGGGPHWPRSIPSIALLPTPDALRYPSPHISHVSGAATNGPWGADGEHGVAQACAWLADNQPDDGSTCIGRTVPGRRAGASNPKGRLLQRARQKSPRMRRDGRLPLYLSHEAPLAACRLSSSNRTGLPARRFGLPMATRHRAPP